MLQPFFQTSRPPRPEQAPRKQHLWTTAALCTLLCGSLPVAADTFNFTGGSQSFTAPSTGLYDIVAYGAGGGGISGIGGSGVGGLGAEIGGYFTLTAGEILTIDVGGQGGGQSYDGGGGGGSFIVAPGSAPLVIAGGGGGKGYPGFNGGNATITTTGGAGLPGGAGGTNGAGGDNDGSGFGGGGGAGFSGNGQNANNSGFEGGGGSDYANGLGGGYGDFSGGFGGGGGAGDYGGGGGGGYGGGGAGGEYGGGGGGGAPYLDPSALDTTLTAGVESGNGMVTITEVPAAVPEPGSLALFGLTLIALSVYLRYSNHSQAGSI